MFLARKEFFKCKLSQIDFVIFRQIDAICHLQFYQKKKAKKAQKKNQTTARFESFCISSIAICTRTNQRANKLKELLKLAKSTPKIDGHQKKNSKINEKKQKTEPKKQQLP